MKRMIVCSITALLLALAWQASTPAQTPAAPARTPAAFQPAPEKNGPMPTVGSDITKADIDFVLKNAPANPPDRQLRVVDMGKYNLGVGIIHRGPTNDKPGAPIQVIYHDYTPEVYIITSGSGVLTTGGVIENMRASLAASQFGSRLNLLIATDQRLEILRTQDFHRNGLIEGEHQLQNLSQVFTQMRAVPNLKDGKTDGFRVFAIRRESIFDRIGLENNDVVQRVNGVELTDPARAMSLLTELQGETRLTVDVLRGGAPRTLSYEIR